MAGQLAVDRVAEQSDVFEDDQQCVRSARDHLAGFLGARARVEFPVGAAGGREETGGVGNGEFPSQLYGLSRHAVDERIVTDHAVIVHADTVSNPKYSVNRNAAR